ncbi:hypothetical protein [Brevundimonas subvibrioides]|uniref:hypothetical protein n=1 Tax=Brevundimonas subvibrioides TaxID=74313 RepID=UPI0022B439E1|nr:hypothetical protein [Brevundimonas subvibrioides]
MVKMITSPADVLFDQERAIDGNDVIELLSTINTLRDSTLTEVLVTSENGLPIVQFSFQARTGSDFNKIKLLFLKVESFSIDYNSDDVFLNVSDLKFLHLKNGRYYISLDPDPGTLISAGVNDLEQSSTDRFFVLSGQIFAVLD